jgi:hypothetical protein
MRYQLPDGRIVALDQVFAHDGVNYPADWLRRASPDERVALGLSELPPIAAFDARWFFAPGEARPLDAIKATRIAELAAIRFANETAGVSGWRSDRESQALLTGAALAASLDPEYTIDWKGERGWTTLDAVQLLAAAQTVRGHVQACFSNERVLAAAIDAGEDMDAVLAIDLGQGWPSSI